MTIRTNRLYAALAVGAAFSLAAPLASAATGSCARLAIDPTDCYTSSIPANSVNHFVHVSTSPYVAYRVIDTQNGIVVNSGSAGLWPAQRTVTGLYGRYQLHITRSPYLGQAIAGSISNN